MVNKITQQEIDTNKVEGKRNPLKGSVQQNQSVFDKLSLLAINRINQLIDWITTVITNVDAHKTAEVLDHPDGCVTEEKIAVGSVTTEKIADGSITTSKFTDNSINARVLSEETIEQGKLKPLCVNESKIVDGNITERKLSTAYKNKINTAIDGKVDKVTGKGLSTNDFTTAEKEKLEGLENYDDTELRGLISGKENSIIYGRRYMDNADYEYFITEGGVQIRTNEYVDNQLYWCNYTNTLYKGRNGTLVPVNGVFTGFYAGGEIFYNADYNDRLPNVYGMLYCDLEKKVIYRYNDPQFIPITAFVDTELSDTSTNAISNTAVTTVINSLNGDLSYKIEENRLALYNTDLTLVSHEDRIYDIEHSRASETTFGMSKMWVSEDAGGDLVLNISTAD